MRSLPKLPGVFCASFQIVEGKNQSAEMTRVYSIHRQKFTGVQDRWRYEQFGEAVFSDT
jgi:hypothetical protein